MGGGKISSSFVGDRSLINNGTWLLLFTGVDDEVVGAYVRIRAVPGELSD